MEMVSFPTMFLIKTKDDRIFVIEGLITIVFSIFVFIFVPNFPARDTWLSESDKRNLLKRLEADKGIESNDNSQVPWKKIVFDYKIWIM